MLQVDRGIHPRGQSRSIELLQPSVLLNRIVEEVRWERLAVKESRASECCLATLQRSGNRHAITILVYDRGMPVSVNVQTAHPCKLAVGAARGRAGRGWLGVGPALGKVWEFIRSQPGLRTGGHNILL